MRYGIAVVAALLLSGCVTTRFVKVPCLTKEEYQKRVDAEPEKVGGTLTGDAQKDVKITGASAVELRKWGRGNLDILSGCTG